eukprot:1349479-Rhodomonas_salina.2
MPGTKWREVVLFLYLISPNLGGEKGGAGGGAARRRERKPPVDAGRSIAKVSTTRPLMLRRKGVGA